MSLWRLLVWKRSLFNVIRKSDIFEIISFARPEEQLQANDGPVNLTLTGENFKFENRFGPYPRGACRVQRS